MTAAKIVMQNVPEHDALVKIVWETLSNEFQNVRILDVQVHYDSDRDNDDVLKIEVVFEGKSRDLNSRSVSGAVRHVRPLLRKMGERAFPVISFITKGDAGRRLETV